MMQTSTNQPKTKPSNAACPLELRAAMALAFFDEVLAAADTLGAIAEAYGQRTLLDLFYLQGALLSGDCIDAWAGETRVVEFLRELPSAADWLANVRVQTHDGEAASAESSRAAGGKRTASLALAEAERRFEAAGGRGVILAEDIDRTRAERTGSAEGGR